MYESISKNNELENEMTLDMSYFWYSDEGDIAMQASWSAHLVKSLWQFRIDQWIARNKNIYGKTKEEQVEKKTQEINKQIQAIHKADKFRVRDMDRHLFTLSLKKRLEQSLDRKQKWVECVTIA